MTNNNRFLTPLEKACREHGIKPKSAADWKKLAEALAAKLYSPRGRGRPPVWSQEDYAALLDDYAGIAHKNTDTDLSKSRAIELIRGRKNSEWRKYSHHYLRRQLKKAFDRNA